MKLKCVLFFVGRMTLVNLIILCLSLSSNLLMAVNNDQKKLVQSNVTDTSKAQLFVNGLEFYRQGKYELALLFLEKSFESHLLHSDIYFYLGNLYYHKKDFEKASLFYHQGIQLKSENSDELESFLYNLALTYYSMQEYQKCLDVYSRIEELLQLKQKPIMTMVPFYQGVLYYQLGNEENAITKFEEYLTIAPKNERYDKVQKLLAWFANKKDQLEKLNVTEQGSNQLKPNTQEKQTTGEHNQSNDESSIKESAGPTKKKEKINIDQIKIRRQPIKLKEIDLLYPKKKEIDIPDEVEEST